MILAANENLSVAAPERISEDKNLIFVGIYKDNFYFLDKYSIQVKKNSAAEKSWQQHIFSIGAKISSENSSATIQKFYTYGKNIFNSSKSKNNLAEIENSENQKFLQECFKVGYYYAFGEEFSFD